MTVYVDDMYRYPIGRFRQMRMSHMIADSEAELLRMADRIGIDRRWIQDQGTGSVHFDICLEMRTKAVALGAVEITYRDFGAMVRRREVIGTLGLPHDAVDWLKEHRYRKRQEVAHV